MSNTTNQPAAPLTSEDEKITKSFSDTETLQEASASTSKNGSSLQKSKKDPKSEENASGGKKISPEEPPLTSVLQLKITLRYVTPEIWRRIQVLNDITFFELRRNINEAMGWFSDRSHQFIVYDPKKDSNIIIANGCLEGLVYDFEKDKGWLLKEQDTKLRQFFNEQGDTILYEFDLAESWIHEVVLEKVLAPAENADYPRCLGGKRACPPEDCGGVDGFQHLLEVYNDTEHEEYEELIEDWLEDMYPGYNPEVFNKNKVFRKQKILWLPMLQE